MCKDSEGSLSRIASGAGDGEVKVWDLASQKSIWNVENAHRGMVKGVCFSQPMVGEEGRVEKKPKQQTSDGIRERNLKRKRSAIGFKGKGRAGMDDDLDDLDDEEYQEEQAKIDLMESKGSERVLSCSTDKTVKLWDIKGQSGKFATPLQTYNGKAGFKYTPLPTSIPLFIFADREVCVPVQFNLSSSIRSLVRRRFSLDRDFRRNENFPHLDLEIPFDFQFVRRGTHCQRRIQQIRDERIG